MINDGFVLKLTNFKKIASDLEKFGGILKCSKCHKELPLENVADKLKNGWTKCCGFTMTWLTDKQLKKEMKD